MENPEPHFTGRVENYIKYRPRYPQALIELLQREGVPKTAVLADIGSGTGLLAEVFLAHGHSVFGIEPDCDPAPKLWRSESFGYTRGKLRIRVKFYHSVLLF